MKPELDENQVLGVFCKAMAACPVHKRYVLSDILTMVLPPIRLQQYRFFEGAGSYGVITWAFLSREAAEKHVRNREPLTIEEWRSGSDLWIISLIGKEIEPRKLVPSFATSLPHDCVHYIRRDDKLRVKKIVAISRTDAGFKVATELLTHV